MSSFPGPSVATGPTSARDPAEQLLTRFDQPAPLLERAAPRRSPLGAVRARLDVLGTQRGDDAGYLDAGGTSVLTWSAAARLAVAWSEQFPPGTVVGLRMSAPTAFCGAFLAALASGVCVAPLDPRATPDELGRLLDVLEISDVVVDGDAAAAGLEQAPVNLWMASASGVHNVRRVVASGPLCPEVAVLLPTSGTTGRPKVVPLSESQLVRVASRIVQHHEIGVDDRGYSPLPLFHVNAEVVGVLSTLVAGSSLVVEDRFHRSTFWETAATFGVTWVNLVPAILGILGQEAAPPDAVADRVRFARSASAPLPLAVRERFERRSSIAVLETYGMTEAASQIAANPLLVAARRPGSVGQPVGVSVRIVDDDGEEIDGEEVGAVEIGGPNVVECYLDAGRTPRPARAANGWLPTGDRGRRDRDGFLYLAGRSDEVINRGGEKYYPREIEEVLRRDGRVQAAAVVTRPHPLLGEEPIAYVVLDVPRDGAERTADRDRLLATCEEALSRYKQPAEIVVLDAMPVGPTGKVARAALRRLAAETVSAAAASAVESAEKKAAVKKESPR